jgi:hypothetical protein
MQIEFTKKFGKQVNKCHDDKIRSGLSKIIGDISKAQDLSEIRNIKNSKVIKTFSG